MSSQDLTTARLGIQREPKSPASDLKREVASIREWIPSTLPGCVMTDLLRAGLLRDPYKDFQSREAAWVGEGRFVYLIPFRGGEKTKTRQNVFLTLDGVDTYARVFLNGRLLYRTNNAFRRWESEITGPFRWENDNLLAVVLDPILSASARSEAERLFDPMGHPERLSIRRCQMTFGWNLCPPLVSPGIRRGVRIDYRGPAWIEDLWVHTVYARPEAAYLEVKWRVRATAARFDGPVRITLKIDKAGETEKRVVPIESFRLSPDELSGGLYEAEGTETITWANPPLWHPHTHGTPSLHKVEGELRFGGVLWDRRSERYGIRVVEIEEKPTGEGRETFRVLVNGTPVGVRGAAWVPSDAVKLESEADRLDGLLEKAASLRINLLRVWGGGLYESERFYRRCDELGILVWQDFPFVAGAYPGDDRFAEGARLEVLGNVRRLRRHASLAVLCGSAEVHQLYYETVAWKTRGALECAPLFEKTFAGVCADEAPGIPYRPGTPWGGELPNDAQRGDTHAWWWWLRGDPPDSELRPMPSFVSEMGVPTAPDPRTIDQWITQENHHVASGIGEHALRGDYARLVQRIAVGDSQPDWDRCLTEGWELQARAVSGLIERVRVSPAESGGAIVWTLNDAFPGFSWGLIDWALRARPVVFDLRRAWADVLMKFIEDMGSLELRVLNDSAEALEGRARVTMLSFLGERLYEKEIPVSAKAREMAVLWREGLEAVTGVPGHAYVVSARLECGDRHARTYYLPAPPSKLVLPRAEVIVTCRPDPSETTLQFRSDRFVRWVLVQTDSPGDHMGLFGFDLLPGEPVICSLSAAARKARFRALSPGLGPKTIDLTLKDTYAWSCDPTPTLRRS